MHGHDKNLTFYMKPRKLASKVISKMHSSIDITQSYLVTSPPFNRVFSQSPQIQMTLPVYKPQFLSILKVSQSTPLERKQPMKQRPRAEQSPKLEVKSREIPGHDNSYLVSHITNLSSL